MKAGHRWGARAVVLVFGSAAVLSAADTAHAQAGNPFPITTMPSMTAPAPTPAPDQPSSALLPAAATPPPAAGTAGAPCDPERAAPTSADRPERFGEHGQIAISGQFSANIGFLSYDQSSASRSSMSVEPAFHYFFANHLLVGASLLLRYEDETSVFGIESSTNTFGASAVFGADVPLGGVLSVEPVASIGFWQAQTSFQQAAPGRMTSVGGTAVAAGPDDVAQTTLFVSLYAPLLVHPAPHLFLGLGPEVSRDLVHSVDVAGTSVSPRRTFVGVSSVVGGWF